MRWRRCRRSRSRRVAGGTWPVREWRRGRGSGRPRTPTMDEGAGNEVRVAGEGLRRLTAGERAVYARRAGGEPVAGIAGALGVTQRTVRFHLENVYAKLGITGGSAAARQLALARLLDRERGG